MLERLKLLYNEGKITKSMLTVATLKKWITQKEKALIINENSHE